MPDQAEARGVTDGEAGGVLGEDAGLQGPQAGAFAVLDELGEEPTADSVSAGGGPRGRGYGASRPASAGR